MAAKKKKVKKVVEKIDGLSAKDISNIRKALRQAWTWSTPWRLVKARCLGEDGFPRCENKKCPAKGKPVPKIFVDHIEVLGEVTGYKYIERMWTASKNLQGLCKKCHDAKTKQERNNKKENEDFY